MEKNAVINEDWKLLHSCTLQIFSLCHLTILDPNFLRFFHRMEVTSRQVFSSDFLEGLTTATCVTTRKLIVAAEAAFVHKILHRELFKILFGLLTSVDRFSMI